MEDIDKDNDGYISLEEYLGKFHFVGFFISRLTNIALHELRMP